MRFWTNKALTLIATESVKLSSDTLKCMLFAGQKSGTCTNSNASVTGINTTGLTVGMYITGTGIQSGTTLQAIPSPGVSGTITLSLPYTGTTGAQTLTFHPHEDLDFVGDVSGIEVSGTGYTAGFGGGGRKSLSARTMTEDDANNRVKIGGVTNLSWSGLNAGILTGFAVMKEVTNDGASPLLFYCADGGFPITTNGGTFDLIWDPIGIATFTVSVQ